MTSIPDSFFQNYAEARAKFLDAALAAGLPVTSYVHPLRGRDQEVLALDTVLVGPRNAKNIAILSSAVHGVEGFCGSGVQVQALRDAGWRGLAGGSPGQAGADGVAVLFLHAVNPWGFSHLRRVTHENVDLNRNFLDFTQALPENAAYRELHALLLPASWPPGPEIQQQVQAYIAARGMKALQAAVSAGQYEFPHGIFYGGTTATWSNLTLRQVLRDYCASAEHIGWVDLHSGLGLPGVGERIYSGHSDDAGNYARCVNWWGNAGATPITRLDDGSTSSSDLNGNMRYCINTELAHAKVTKITLEFGTALALQGLQALRAEQWLQMHPEAPAAHAAAIKQALRDFFYVDTDTWKTQIVQQGVQALAQMVSGLAAQQALPVHVGA